MRSWLAVRLIPILDRLAYWLLAVQKPLAISDCDPRTQSTTSE